MADRTPSANLWSRSFAQPRPGVLAVRRSARVPGERWRHRRSSTGVAPDRPGSGPRGDLTGRLLARMSGRQHRAAAAFQVPAHRPVEGLTEDRGRPYFPPSRTAAKAPRPPPRSSLPSERAEAAVQARRAALRRLRGLERRSALAALEETQDHPSQGALEPKETLATPTPPGQVAVRGFRGSAREARRGAPAAPAQEQILLLRGAEDRPRPRSRQGATGPRRFVCRSSG